MAGPERKLAAILSADVVGYNRLMAEDEGATVHTITDYREEILAVNPNLTTEIANSMTFVTEGRLKLFRRAGLP